MTAGLASGRAGRRRRLGLPRLTIRLRLTVLYGAVFFLTGAILLALTYFLVARQFRHGVFVRQITARPIVARAIGGPPLTGVPPGVRFAVVQPHVVSDAALGTVLGQFQIALAITALLSVWLGWVVAGRALRPLRAVTDAAREISASDLHRRLAVSGADDELAQLGTTFNGLLARLEGAFDAQRRFVANASHELRTPLTLQRTLVQVALADPDATVDSLREMGVDVLAAGERQERLIDALLTLSRSQSGLERHETVDLAALAADALRTLDAGGLSLETSLEPARTTGDPRLVERLVANLLDNAVRHNVAEGRVSVATRTRGGTALLLVSNSGPEIPPGELARLRQPFQRLDDRRGSSEGGLGLGLSIVDAVATAHDATLVVRSRLGGGLEVEVAFPARS